MTGHALRLGRQLAWLDHHGQDGSGIYAALQRFLMQIPQPQRAPIILIYVTGYTRTAARLRNVERPYLKEVPCEAS